MVIPKIISIVVLGIIFYLGVLLNVYLLELNAAEETIVKVSSLALLILIIMLGVYLAYHQANQPYNFYKDRIEAGRKALIHYTDITGVSKKQNILDKIFRTYNLDLGNKNFLRNLPEEIQIENYLQQLRAYSKNLSG
ncbi:hypothetical protein HZC32_00270 [Candidatus Woesearchaeota archaeon]|nr:hypothetical protein [Candidatus Woesearchaeota archaeon]